jgi:DNA-binding NarL/FixJ family response regulator
MNKIKVFIVDDHKIVRDGIYSMLINDNTIEPIGEAQNGTELFQKIKEIIPDVILLDISMPGISGIEISKKLSDNYPQIRVLILTMTTDEKIILSAINAGIKGFLSKDTSKEELLKAIKTVFEGNEYFGTGISQIVYKSYVNNVKLNLHLNRNELTDRETEVIKYISDGLSYKEIGALMYISPRTVETHRNNILSKLNLNTNIELVKHALKNNLIDL